jgi:hypothetical protein
MDIELKRKTRIYPFIDKIVETFYDEFESILDQHVEEQQDKSIIMMYILMYFTVHVKLKEQLSKMTHNERRDTIKTVLSDIIRDPEKRRMCLQMFENKFRVMFQEPILRIE